MGQAGLTIALDVQPRSLIALRSCIDKLKRDVEAAGGGSSAAGYAIFGTEIPGLHFASVMIFDDERYDPLLTIELNFDGKACHFLPRLETPRLQPALRDMIRCCKPPRGTEAAMYEAVTRRGSRLPLAPFLETRIVRPAVFHQGNRGLDRERVSREAALFDAAQQTLSEPTLANQADAVILHGDLRRELRPAHPWLDDPEPARWTTAERCGEVARLAAFAVLVLLGLSLPGIVLHLLLPTAVVLGIALLGVLGFAVLIRRVSPPVTVGATPPESPALPRVSARPLFRRPGLWVLLATAVAAYVIIAGALLGVPLLPFRHEPATTVLRTAMVAVLVGLVTVPAPVAALVYWLRRLEVADACHDDPRDDPDRLRRILALEDQVAQNHMGSIVLVKPGLLRALLLRLGLTGLGLVLRATRTDGYLGSMRTIHFAHWAVLSNGGRLAFFSNFDGSWESYLDDFIEKAHEGLTLAWTNGVGFPPTRFLVRDGATNGRLFKAWARHSMAESLFWFSAYRDLSVNQIERQAAIASGLRKRALTPEEATQWARHL